MIKQGETNRELVLKAVSQYGNALEYAAESLKEDKEVVLAAVSKNGQALRYAAASLQSDKEVVLAAVSQDGYALEYAAESLKEDKEVVLAAVSQYGYALQYAAESLKEDKEVVLAAVSQNGWALEYAAESLKKNILFVRTLIDKNGLAFAFLDESLKQNVDIVKRAVKQNGLVLQYVSNVLRDNRSIVDIAIKQNEEAINYASPRIKLEIERKGKESYLASAKNVRDAFFSKKLPIKQPVTNTKNSEAPESYRCPITHEIMLDPVLASDGYDYEREAIDDAFKISLKSPMTNEDLETALLFPNRNLKSSISEHLGKFPDDWDEVYYSEELEKTLLALSSGADGVDIEKWQAVLRKDPRFLFLPLGVDKVTLFEYILGQKDEAVREYLPKLIPLFKSKEYDALRQYYSLLEWISYLADTSYRVGLVKEFSDFIQKMQKEIGFDFIVEDWALYALDENNLTLFNMSILDMKDINKAIDAEGNTLLHLSAEKGCTDFVQALLDKGANLNQRNEAGLKPKNLALNNGYQEAADTLAFKKVAPVLERVGIFSALNRIDALEKELNELKQVNTDNGCSSMQPSLAGI